MGYVTEEEEAPRVAPYGHPEAHVIWTETIRRAGAVPGTHVIQTTERILYLP